MKLAINLMIMLTSGMLAEALSLGRKGGLEWSDMWQVIDASAVGSPIVKAKASALSKRDFTATFTVEQMRKDVGLILDAGKMLNVPLGLTALTAQLLSSASAQGYAGEDYAAIIKVVEQAANLSEVTL
jgi:3-hydroxyisobutyrate dehydrogenase